MDLPGGVREQQCTAAMLTLASQVAANLEIFEALYGHLSLAIALLLPSWPVPPRPCLIVPRGLRVALVLSRNSELHSYTAAVASFLVH